MPMNTSPDHVASARDLTSPEFDVERWLHDVTSRSERSALLDELTGESAHSLTAHLGQEDTARLLSAVSPSSAARFGAHLDPVALALSLQSLPAHVVADVLRGLQGNQYRATLAALDPVVRDDIDALLRWDPESAGANMTPSFLVLPGALRVSDAIETLRETAREVESASYIYLVDEEGRLMGAVSFRRLVTADPEGALADEARAVLQTVEPTLDREEAAKILDDYDLAALPVTLDGRPLGVITADRAAEIMEAETTEDFRRLGTAGGLRASLKGASIWLLYRSRIGWLVVLVFGNLFSGAGIAHYEDLIERVVSLVFFLPLLIDSGGNAGSQASTLMVRALATGDVVLRDWLRLMVREVIVAVLLGLTMAVAVSTVGFVRGGPAVALVVSLTMIVIVVFGSVVGMSLPFLLSKFNLDPASASAPLITTICDGMGVLIYFFIASQFLL